MFETVLAKIAAKISLKGVAEGLSKVSWKVFAKVGLGGGLLVGAASFIYSIPSALSSATGGILSTQASTLLLALGVVAIVIVIARRH